MVVGWHWTLQTVWGGAHHCHLHTQGWTSSHYTKTNKCLSSSCCYLVLMEFSALSARWQQRIWSQYTSYFIISHTMYLYTVVHDIKNAIKLKGLEKTTPRVVSWKINRVRTWQNGTQWESGKTSLIPTTSASHVWRVFSQWLTIMPRKTTSNSVWVCKCKELFVCEKEKSAALYPLLVRLQNIASGGVYMWKWKSLRIGFSFYWRECKLSCWEAVYNFKW